MCDLQSDVNSPGQQQGSPIGAMQLSGGCHDELSGDNISGVQRNGPLDDPAWPYDAEDLEVRKLVNFICPKIQQTFPTSNYAVLQ